MKKKMDVCKSWRMVAGACALMLLGPAVPRSFADGPPPLPDVGVILSAYRFDDTNWLSYRGYAPSNFYGLESVTSWTGGTNAVRLAGSGSALLQYRYQETNGQLNISAPRGSIWFWYRPLAWSSTNITGGTGPGAAVRLLEMGSYTVDASVGWFSIYLDPSGTSVLLSGQTNGAGATFAQAGTSFASNTWHMVAVNYTETNSEIYVDGQLASGTNSTGVVYWPSPSVLSNGFAVGGELSGSASTLAHGDIENLRTYDGPIPGEIIGGSYSNTIAIINGGGGGGDPPSGGGGGLDGPEGGGGVALHGCTNGVEFLVPPVWSGTNLVLSICGGATNGVYDLYFITNFAPTRTWSFLTRSGPGVTDFTVGNLPDPAGFFVIGATNDFDGDGMTDAWENLVSHTATNVAQPPFKVFITQPVSGTLFP